MTEVERNVPISSTDFVRVFVPAALKEMSAADIGKLFDPPHDANWVTTRASQLRAALKKAGSDVVIPQLKRGGGGRKSNISEVAAEVAALLSRHVPAEEATEVEDTETTTE